MKIRTGFVSNSSSSSFVVGFQSIPQSKKELRTLLFGDQDTYKNPYPWEGHPQEWSAAEVADVVWNDLKKQKVASSEIIADELQAGYFFRGIYEKYFPTGKRIDFGSSEYKKADDAYTKEMQKLADKAANEFVKDNPVVFIFEYSDNDGHFFCALEHGGLFDRLPHIVISKH